MQVEWEKSSVQELDITATDLSTECLIDMLTRIPTLRFLSAGQINGFNDSVTWKTFLLTHCKKVFIFLIKLMVNSQLQFQLQCCNHTFWFSCYHHNFHSDNFWYPRVTNTNYFFGGQSYEDKANMVLFTLNPKHFWFPSVLIIIMVIRQVRVITIYNEESIKITHLEKYLFQKFTCLLLFLLR